MNHPLISQIIIGDDLVMHTTEELGVHLHLELAFFRKSDLQVFRTNNDFNWFIWTHPTIDGFKAFAIELNQVVLDHATI